MARALHTDYTDRLTGAAVSPSRSRYPKAFGLLASTKARQRQVARTGWMWELRRAAVFFSAGLLVFIRSAVHAGVVTTDPQPAVPGTRFQIWYDPAGGPLPSGSQVRIHHGINNWSEQATVPPGEPMTWDERHDAWVYAWEVPLQATQLDFVFTDGGANWDNCRSQDWHVQVNLWRAGEQRPAEPAFRNLLQPRLSCPAGLIPRQGYSWQVVARNACGETAGPVWNFSTRAAPGNLFILHQESTEAPFR